MAKKKKDRDWKGGKGIKGTVRAAITHHPDKFDADCKDPGKLCPYAIFTAMKKKGFESHYKDQKSTVKGDPKKKAKFKDEDKKESDYYSFKDYCDFREAEEAGVHPSIERAIKSMRHVRNADQAEGHAQNHHFNDSQAQKDFPNNKEGKCWVRFGKAVRAEYERRNNKVESLSHGDCKYCDSRINPGSGDQIHSVECPKYKEWYRKKIIAGRASTGG